MTTLLVIGASLVAILALYGLNVWLLGWSPGGLASLDEAGARLAADYVGFEPGGGVLSSDGRAALVADAASPKTGLAVAHGGGVTTRLLSAGDIRSAEVSGAGVLDLRLADFTLPRVSIRMQGREAAREWAERLKGPSKGEDG